MRISDWSSDVCSSDLIAIGFELGRRHIGPCKRSEAAYAIAVKGGLRLEPLCDCRISASLRQNLIEQAAILIVQRIGSDCLDRLEHRKLAPFHGVENRVHLGRSEEHTSELQSLMRISYAVFCLQKKNKLKSNTDNHNT